MAGLWDKLSVEDQNAIAKQAMVGSKQSNENLNRVRQQLAENPDLVMRFAEDAGIEIGAELQEGTEPEESIDEAVDANLAENDETMEETGGLTKTNADLETRVRELEHAIQSGQVGTDYTSSRRGRSPTNPPRAVNPQRSESAEYEDARRTVLSNQPSSIIGSMIDPQTAALKDAIREPAIRRRDRTGGSYRGY